MRRVPANGASTRGRRSRRALSLQEACGFSEMEALTVPAPPSLHKCDYVSAEQAAIRLASLSNAELG